MSPKVLTVHPTGVTSPTNVSQTYRQANSLSQNLLTELTKRKVEETVAVAQSEKSESSEDEVIVKRKSRSK